MTTPDQILVDLLTSDSTADALAERLRVPMLAIRAMCQRLETDGLVTARPINQNTLTAYRITDAGREVAAVAQQSIKAA